jgi:hypothetical protein
MPSESKKQQQFFGIVHAIQSGKKKAEGKAGEVAKDMDPKDVKKFAETKHEGLPERKPTQKEAGRLGYIAGYKEAGLVSDLLHSILYGGQAKAVQARNDAADDRIRDVRALKQQRQQGTSTIDRYSGKLWSLPKDKVELPRG